RLRIFVCALTFLSISKTFFPSILRIDIASVSGRSDDRSLFAGAGVNFLCTIPRDGSLTLWR
ncbi:MAG: hypothetical protein ACPGRG_14930, partial [Marinomonas sp.]